MAMVFPKPGEEKATAQRLLALASSVHDVGTNTDEGLAFVVPDYLYQLFLAEDPVDESPASVEQAKRRPGRPRKAQPVSEEGE